MVDEKKEPKEGLEGKSSTYELAAVSARQRHQRNMFNQAAD
jgi:hypothetical protein